MKKKRKRYSIYIVRSIYLAKIKEDQSLYSYIGELQKTVIILYYPMSRNHKCKRK